MYVYNLLIGSTIQRISANFGYNPNGAWHLTPIPRKPLGFGYWCQTSLLWEFYYFKLDRIRLVAYCNVSVRLHFNIWAVHKLPFDDNVLFSCGLVNNTEHRIILRDKIIDLLGHLKVKKVLGQTVIKVYTFISHYWLMLFILKL